MITTPFGKAVHSPNQREQVAATVELQSWGNVALYSVIGALGLFVVAWGYTAARMGQPSATPLFWGGLLTLFVPTAWRLAAPGTPARERLALIGILAIGLYCVKVLRSPDQWTFHDELIHWRTTQDIVASGRLFAPNPLITVSPFFPGLQLVTAAVMQLTGLSAFGAGVIVLGVARLVLALGLYLFFNIAARSHRVAGIATLLYLSNPNGVFFGAQFAYESLALPFTAMVLFLIARRVGTEERERRSFNLVILLGLVAVVTTHHITSYALVAFLMLWSVTPFMWQVGRAWGRWYAGFGTSRELGQSFKARARPLLQQITGAQHWDSELVPGEVALLALVLSLAWLVYVATLVVGYLAPVFSSALREVLGLIAGQRESRQLFVNHAGQRNPLAEQLLGYGSVLFVLIGLPVGLARIWRLYRTNALALTLALGALAYPAALALRLTQAGAETSNRSSEFLFLPIAFVLAIGFGQWQTLGRLRWLRPLLFSSWAAVIFVGGTIIGWPNWGRLPGSYMISADTRSITTEGITAAQWSRQFLGTDNRFGADRINRLLLAAYGEQRVVTNLSEGTNVAFVFFARQIGQVERDILQRLQAHYLMVDQRLTTGLPIVGVYFENGEPGANRHTTPMDPTVLAKFDQVPDVSRLFDSGEIVIYDMQRLIDAPQQP